MRVLRAAVCHVHVCVSCTNVSGVHEVLPVSGGHEILPVSGVHEILPVAQGFAGAGICRRAAANDHRSGVRDGRLCRSQTHVDLVVLNDG